jgi:integrase
VRRSVADTHQSREDPALFCSARAKFHKQKLRGAFIFYVDHLRRDIRSILKLAMEDGHIEHNPAGSINTPRKAAVKERKMMAREEVSKAIGALEFREALIVKLAVCCGMRPGEILGLKWGHVSENYIEIRQRVYRGVIDTPKTRRSIRKIGLPPEIVSDLASWRSISQQCGEDDWVFPSERLTPISRDNLWRRTIHNPSLKKSGLDGRVSRLCSEPFPVLPGRSEPIERSLPIKCGTE